jgi:hypothetical protein
MARPDVVTSPATVLAMMSLFLAPPSHSETPPPPKAEQKALQRLLDRASATVPGTYLVGEANLEPAPVPLPLVLQADAYRGPERTTRVTVILGGDVPAATEVRLRMLGPPATPGAAARPVAEAIASGQSGAMRLVREFTLAPGDYDLVAAVGHARPEGGLRAALLTQRVSVPDVWRGSLAVTPLVLGDAVSEAPRAAGGRSLVFGPTALSPAITDGFPQGGAMHVAYRIFNWKAEPGQKPDLTAEYTFRQQTGKRLLFFNKTKPQKLRADTLAKGFDPAAGVVSAGMSIPLQGFPFGEFQLTVRVTDNATHQSGERQVRFVVVP